MVLCMLSARKDYMLIPIYTFLEFEKFSDYDSKWSTYVYLKMKT